MSTILKALRRLENERLAPVSERPLREAVAAAPAVVEPRRRAWLAPVLALVLGIGVGAAVLLLWPRGEPSPPTDVAKVESPMTVAAAEPPPLVADGGARGRRLAAEDSPRDPDPLPEAVREPAPQSAASAETGGPPDQAFSSGVSIVNRPTREPRIIEPADTSPGPAERPGAVPPAAQYTRKGQMAAAAVAAERSRSETAKAQTTTATAVAKAAPAAAPVPQRVSTARATPQPTQPRPSERAAAPAPVAPPVAEQSPTPPTPEVTRAATAPDPAPKRAQTASPAGASEIQVASTRWHPLAERREAFVKVPGREGPIRIKEGDPVAGYQVAEIKPSGVVFERDGVKSTRKIGVE